MKCEMICDLLPLYIDGLTSEESNREIEKHLKSCKECTICLQEMEGKMGSLEPITDEEIVDLNIIKRIKKKNRRKAIVVAAVVFIGISILAVWAFSQVGHPVKFEEIVFDYGVQEDAAYFEITSKPGYNLLFSGSQIGNDVTLKVLAARKIGSLQKDKMRWKEAIGSEDDPCKWTLEFEDKTIVIENGKLAEEYTMKLPAR